VGLGKACRDLLVLPAKADVAVVDSVHDDSHEEDYNEEDENQKSLDELQNPCLELIRGTSTSSTAPGIYLPWYNQETVGTVGLYKFKRSQQPGRSSC
jgi:hypothetical protein